MFKKLEFDRFVTLCETNERVTVYQELPGDRLTPTNAYHALAATAKSITLLESSPKEKHLGRYSHLCFDPIAIITANGRDVIIDCDGESQSRHGNPFDILREYQSKLDSKADHPLCGFAGGMVGYLSYDAIRLIEDIPDNNRDVDQIPDMRFKFYTSNITFDHQTGKVILSTVPHVPNNSDLQAVYEAAMQSLQLISQQLLQNHHTDTSLTKAEKRRAETQVDIDDACYREMVNVAKEKIIEGDIFQVVLSRQFSIESQAKPFDIYRALRFSNPSPYMFYIEEDDYVIAGASPEKLVSIQSGVIEACPLAGTRPRRENQDHALAAELLADEKEVAEHMMLVDLCRNDIGAVAVPGSVAVTKLKEIEKFSRVMHISSTVQGLLREDRDPLDVLKAAFPAGTLSGAPKIRAMEIVDELESTKRGIYGGAVCGIDSSGNLNSCIAIRTTLIKDGKASVRAGAGVVFDSDPQAEADETRHKARAILEGIMLAEEGAL